MHPVVTVGVDAAGNRRKWTLVAVCLTTFMLLLDITVVVVALPNIQRRFDAGLTGLQWVIDAYALTLAVHTPGQRRHKPASRQGGGAIELAGIAQQPRRRSDRQERD